MPRQVRKFSPAGACIVLGEFLRETPAFYFYRDREGTERRVGARGLAHIEPCSSCRDHAHTQYPSEEVVRAEREKRLAARAHLA